MRNDKTYEGNPYLRIVEGNNIEDDSLYNLASVSHLTDHNVILSSYPAVENLEWINRCFKNVWLCPENETYEKDWFKNLVINYKGLLRNYRIKGTIDNDPYGYSYRIGYVNGACFFLTGDREEFLDVESIANECKLDIGIVNVYPDNSFTFSTTWDLLPASILPTQEKPYEDFMNEIFISLRTDSYYNHVTERTILDTLHYMTGLFHIKDETYVDEDESKTLFISDGRSSIGTQIKILIRYKGLTNIHHVDESQLDSINIHDYDYLFFLTSEDFYYRNAMFLQKVSQQFKGKTVNMNCLGNLYRDKNLEKWQEAGIPCSNFVKGFKNIPEIPFDPPYIIRCNSGQDNTSNPVLAYNKESLEEWPWYLWGSKYADFIIQEFVDTSVDGKFYMARALFAGRTIIPSYAIETNTWNCRLSHKIMSKRHHGRRSFYEILPDFSSRCFRDLQKAIDAVGADVGCIDFGMLPGGAVVPWEFAINFGYDYSIHWMYETCEVFAMMVNEMLGLVESKLRIDPDDARSILTEANLETKIWHYPPCRV